MTCASFCLSISMASSRDECCCQALFFRPRDMDGEWDDDWGDQLQCGHIMSFVGDGTETSTAPASSLKAWGWEGRQPAGHGQPWRTYVNFFRVAPLSKCYVRVRTFGYDFMNSWMVLWCLWLLLRWGAYMHHACLLHGFDGKGWTGSMYVVHACSRSYQLCRLHVDLSSPLEQVFFLQHIMGIGPNMAREERGS